MRQETITYFCDRCGKETKYYHRITAIYYNDDELLGCWDEEVDLCDNCHAELKAFLSPQVVREGKI